MDRIGAALRGENPTVLRRLESGFAAIGDAHVWPRFAWESAEPVSKPVWLYPRDRWSDERFRAGPQHDALRDAVGSELDQLKA